MEEWLPTSIPKLFPNWQVYKKVNIFTISSSRHNDRWARQTQTTSYTTGTIICKESKVKDQGEKKRRTNICWTTDQCFLLYKQYFIKFPQNPLSYILSIPFYK